MSTPLPRGIEVLIKKASVDSEFRELLLADPRQAAVSIELELQPVEQAMLQTLPKEQLMAVIDRTEVPLSQRRAFLGRAAAIMLAVLGGGGAAALLLSPAGISPGIKGIQPDLPDPVIIDGKPHVIIDGSPYLLIDGKPYVSLGIRPDEVPAPAGVRPDEPEPIIIEEQFVPVTGIRPDLPDVEE